MLHGYEKMADDPMQGTVAFCKMILDNNLMLCNEPDIKATGICVHEKTLDIKHNTFINTILRQTAMNNPLVNKDDIPGFGFKLFII